ncbi:hypothetical protein [Zavarzinia sp.]
MKTTKEERLGCLSSAALAGGILLIAIIAWAVKTYFAAKIFAWVLS